MNSLPPRHTLSFLFAPLALGFVLVTLLTGLARGQNPKTEARNVPAIIAGCTVPPQAQSKLLQPGGDKGRFYTEEELSATIPPDSEHKHSLRLSSLLTLDDGQFLVTLHQGRDRGDRLAIWNRIGDDRYRLAQLIEAADEGESIDPPTVFKPRNQPIGTVTTFIDAVRSARNTADEFVFALDDRSGEVLPVEIEPPPKDYQSMLQPGETLDDTPDNLFIDNQPAKFEIGILRQGDLPWRPSAVIAGTYKIEKLEATGWNGPKRPPPVWRFIPTGATRQPLPQR